ncbi:erythrocyte membrane protein 1, PfEMP1, putative [Plasmodium sp. DRC-Itaito]|nr:erythrocyte membrane protein 1, PfEMP1, putative [Plasmodium sp. DRC-Itaito]
MVSKISSNIPAQCHEVKEIVRNVVSSSGSGGSRNNSKTPLNVCMKYDTDNLDAGKNLLNAASGTAHKELMKMLISEITYHHSDFNNTSYNGAPCSLKLPNTSKWIWKNITTNGNYKARLKENDEYENTICIPPRTQSLCLGNLNKLSESNLDVKDPNSHLLMEWIIAAKLEGSKLRKQYKNDVDKKKICKVLGYSYADYGDLIKGTSIWENHFTKQLETNLETIFRKVFKDHIEENAKTIGPDKYPKDLKLLRKTWWNTNKQYMLAALIVGAEQSEGEKDSSCVSEMKDSPPTIDYIPQFLRFAQEWGEHFCNQRKTLADNVVNKCQKCVDEATDYHKTSNVDNGGAVGKMCWDKSGQRGITSNECRNCQDMCGKYKTFVEGIADNDEEHKKWRERWKQMDEKYKELIEKYKNKNVTEVKSTCKTDDECVQQTEAGIFKYLYDNGVTTLSSYMNLVLKDANCGSDKTRWDYATVVKETRSSQTTRDSGKTVKKVIYPQLFGSTPAGYKYACQCLVPSREELCRDNHIYNTRWECGQKSENTTPSRHRPNDPIGKQTYELCRLRHDQTDEEDKTTSSTQATLQNRETLSKEDLEFFSFFDSWFKDIQDKLDSHFHRISRDCKLEHTVAQSGSISRTGTSGIISPECQTCRDNCECYKLWVKSMKDQWGKQQKNFETFTTKQQSSGQNISLNDYLFSRCWAEYFEKDLKSKSLKNINHVDDIYIINLLRERCGDNKEKAKKKFQERMNKAQNQTKQCHKKQDRCKKEGETLDCKGMVSGGGNVDNCRGKTYDDEDNNKSNGRKKKWECEAGRGETLEPNVCVPPRTQTLCVANMADSKGSIKGNWSNEIHLKKYLQNVMKKETENLYEYYKSPNDNKGPIIAKTPDGKYSGKPDVNGMPKNFCLAVQRTYNDFKHMVIGDMLSKSPSIKTIDKKIGNIIKNGSKSGTTPATKEEREKWWDERGDEFWKAIKCGIKEATSKNMATKAGGGSTFSGNECGDFYPPESDTYSQFVWWFKEWAQQFCMERKTRMEDITNKCGSKPSERCKSGGKITDELQGDCKTKCEDYKKFISGKKTEWDKQKDKYEREHPGMEVKELFRDFSECGGANFELIFRDTATTGGVVKPSGASDATKYYDASDICSCTDQTYNCEKNTSTCKEKSGHVTTWKTHLLRNGKDNKQLEGVYAPPRRQKLCLANLFPIIFGRGDNTDNKKNTLLNRVKIVAEREAYYLWKHHTSDNKNDDEAHHKACCAIRRSFFDIGDIVKGTDLWDDQSKKYIDETLNDIFKQELEEKQKNKKQKNTQIHPDEIKYARKQWWEHTNAKDMGTNKDKTIRDSVWDAMQCGVTNALTELNKNVKTYKDIHCMKDENGIRTFYLVATPQFVRWLEEWTQQFCEDYTKYIGDIQSKCTGSDTSNDCNDSGGKNGEATCKSACSAYTDWINSKKTEWNGMKNYYAKILQMGKGSDQSPDGTDYDAINQPTAIDYLNQRCNQAIDGTHNCCFCENVGRLTPQKKDKEPLQYMDKVVIKIDEKYKQYMSKCTNCYIQHIKDQIENIRNVLNVGKDQNGKGSSGIGPNNSNHSLNPATTDDICKNNGNINCSKVKSDGPIKVPIDPDDKNTAKNKEDSKLNCGGIPSKESEYIWKHKHGEDYNWVDKLDDKIQIPPRRQKLCYNDLDQSTDINDLKKRLLTAAANEGYNLGIKYNDYKNLYGVKPCKALQYSFNDYKHIILGTDNLEPPENKTESNMKKIFGAAHSDKPTAGQPGSTERQKWWNENKDCLWKIMKCGYEKGRKEANKKNNNGNDVPDLTTPEGGGTKNDCNMPDDTNNSDQFLSWLREWYEDYCYKKKTLYDEVKEKCKPVGHTDFKCDDKDCKEKCEKYEKFMKDKKTQWDSQNQYYSTKRKNGAIGVKSNGYTESSAQDYLKKKFTTSGSSDNCSDVQKNINLLQQQPTQSPYYDADSHCGCKKYINDDNYKTISGESNCKGLKKAAGENKIKWIHNDGTPQNDYLKKRNVPEEVYLPPRKQNLCFQGFDGRGNKLDNKDKLRTLLMKVAATEGYNLGEYYKNKKEKEGQEEAKNYAYDVSPCSALKYSFYDLRDIILGHDMTEPDHEGTEKHLKNTIFKNGGQNNNTDRKQWWNDHKECVWNAMKCGYKKGRDEGTSGGTTKPSDTELTNCKDLPSETEYPIGKDRPDGMNLQFLRWFAEWGEDFCVKQGRELATLQQKCDVVDCTKTGGEDKKKACKTQCLEYRKFIKKWSPQYEKQSRKYNEQQKKSLYDMDKDAKFSKTAREFLEKKLKKICTNSGATGTTGGCNCMDKPSSQNSDNMPSSLDEKPDSVKDNCDCDKSAPTLSQPIDQATGRSGGTSSGQDSNSIGGSGKGQNIDPAGTIPQEPAHSPAGGDGNSSTGAENSRTATSNNKSNPGTDECGGLSVSGSNFPDSSVFGGGSAPIYKCSAYYGSEIEPTNCVEKSAYLLRKDAENIINKELKIKSMHHIFKNFKSIENVIEGTKGSMYINKNKLDSAYETNDSCPKEGTDRLDVGKTWRCDNINRRHNNLCLPPRREHMCIKKIQNMMSSKITDNETFLKEVMEAAKDEGIDILKKLQTLKETEFYNICDAMKYSFADIGDIIRGRDLLKTDRKYESIQIRLDTIFRNIYDQLKNDKNKYNQDGARFYKLREAWWNANRRNIWKAMTCVAPEGAKLYRKVDKKKGGEIGLQKCGYHNDSPPDYDYIPQRFRWMQEWSEYFCKAKKEKLDQLKHKCHTCNKNSSCTDDTDGSKCEECKEACKYYSDFVKKWQEQFYIQSNKYKELYNKSHNPSTPNNNNELRMPTTRGRRKPRTTVENDSIIIKFLKQLKTQCADPSSAEEYLDKANNCKEYKFTQTNGVANNDGETYAFKDKPPVDYKDSCNCTAPDPLEQCPDGNTNTYDKVCKTLSTKNTCYPKRFNDDLDHWNANRVRDNSDENKGVLLPPRRRYLCIRNITTNLNSIKSKEEFKQKFLQYVYNEGKFLGEKYKNYSTSAHNAMRYSFADYGDIIKDTDMVDNKGLDELRNKLDTLLKENGSTGQSDGREKWWEDNKTKVWHAMLCGYMSKNTEERNNEQLPDKWCPVPTDDKTPQFLRWLEEWSRQFCEEKKTKTISLQKNCLDNDRDKTKSGENKSYKLNDTTCQASYNTYKDWIRSKHDQWKSWKKKYQKEKKEQNVKVDNTIGTSITASPLSKPQKSEQDGTEKYIESKCYECNCKINSLEDMHNQIETHPINSIKTLVEQVQNDIPELKPLNENDIFKYVGILIENVKKIAQTIEEKIHEQASQLEGKKKPILRSTNLFRVIDITQNDYGIPDKTSTNRYVPYASNRYKGKTYIYVEGEETHDYVRDISSSDITSSSESEYEEMDINDIYPYKSPKYKTLIEVVLKPSRNTYDTRDNHIDHMENTQDTHHIHMDKNDDSNKITDNEWNSLKNDFISNILQNTQMGLPNENTTYDNMYKDRQLDDNILRVNKEEKPFISEIQDRDLHNKEHFTYNINRNIPEKFNRTTSIIDDLKYFSYNLYSGTDLINDSLNGDQHVDIYDELLKRKENELFGKKTSTKY